MGVEVRLLGVRCNIQCQYCYQNPPRDAGNVPRTYDLEATKAAIAAEGRHFTLFGGEPLMVPLPDLEALWAWGLERYGRNSVQTNGSLITDAHVDLFKRYKVQVGLSVDGPGELNDVRWAGTLARTREATARTQAAVERLCQEGISPRLIVTLHRGNATPDKLPVMQDWFRRLDGLGVTSARLHILETESEEIRRRYALTTEENLAAFLSFARLESVLTRLRFDVFSDIRRLLRGQDDEVTCVWNACDPYTTHAVRGVEGNGQRSNCGRTYKEGVEFAKAATEGFERYLALYQTPQTYGGCQGCRFFLMCKGQCPGTAIDHNWRNRTADCAVWMGLFEHFEAELVAAGEAPLSVSPQRAEVETALMTRWSRGQNSTIASVLRQLDGPADAPATRRESAPVWSAPRAGGRVSSAAVDRLPFTLPDFTRLMWVSDAAREVWAPRLQAITRAWLEIEWRAVLAGVRSCAVTVVSPEGFPDRAARWVDQGLAVLPLEVQGAAEAYASTPVPLEPGTPIAFRSVVGGLDDLRAFRVAWTGGDDAAIGRLLGYPPCCTAFFRRVWVVDGMVDTTWPTAVATAESSAGSRELVVGGPPEANALWRWMGVRAVPHLPCRFDCASTVALGRQFLEVGRAAGHAEEMAWLLEILRWPVEWSALHGIAEVRTPVLKVSTRTDATTVTYVVRFEGDRYPAEGARGLRFPYQTPARPRLTASRAFRRGFEHEPLLMPTSPSKISGHPMRKEPR